MPVVVSPQSSAEPAQAGTHAVTGIVTEGRFFHLREPIQVTEYEERGLWVHECKPLNILACAKTPKESWRVFATQFEATWEWIAQEEDSRLDPGARSLKRKYLDIVGAIESVL